MPKDFEVQLNKKRKDLRHKDMDINTYIEEFQKLCLRSKAIESECVKIKRYLNDIRFDIQEEMNLLSHDVVNKCYHLDLKME